MEGFKVKHKAAEWPKSRAFLAVADTERGEVSEPTCVGKENLLARVAKIDHWAEREQVEFRYVSGLIALRTNKETGEREVLMVHGNDSKTKEPKLFVQPPGGKVHRGEDHVVALHRELDEELEVVPSPTVTYLNTYVQQDHKFAVHAFVYEDCPWEPKDFTYGGDVTRAFWTSKPFEQEYPPTEQMCRVLRQLGFTGPLTKNDPPDEYSGDPTSLEDWATEDLQERRKKLLHYILMSEQRGGADGGIDGEDREEMREEVRVIEEELKRRGVL
jgi:8-oxo-dGTP pyrophosphatase MutT (NUDIX family)